MTPLPADNTGSPLADDDIPYICGAGAVELRSASFERVLGHKLSIMMVLMDLPRVSFAHFFLCLHAFLCARARSRRPILHVTDSLSHCERQRSNELLHQSLDAGDERARGWQLARACL